MARPPPRTSTVSAPKAATRRPRHTGPQGGVTTRSATGAYHPATKTWTHDATTTRPDGSTATTHGERTRTEDGYQRTTTHTGSQGTTTVEGPGSWDPATKTWAREKLVTRPTAPPRRPR